MIKAYIALLISVAAIFGAYFQYKTGRFLSDEKAIDSFHTFRIVTNLGVAILGLFFFLKYYFKF